ncbi:MAG: hypothetical protein R2875_07130 [Desulfobacterales bacterium]
MDLKRYKIAEQFSPAALRSAEAIPEIFDIRKLSPGRTNLIDLPTMTIDGQGTLDLDDAISIEKQSGYYRIGVQYRGWGPGGQRGCH